jgi:oxygen-independent coproporphyrinogen-3 oxidase
MLVDTHLIKKYTTSGPRYTSYPTANNFTPLSVDTYKDQIALSNTTTKPLSLYCHIPFCDTVCFYCGCNKIATKDKTKAQPYLQRLFKEIELQAALLSSSREVKQLHFGGGTPTFLSNSQLEQLTQKLRKEFNFAKDGEFSIEIDPRGVDESTIQALANVGFNRLSLGVQDFDPYVQQAINRIQSIKQTTDVIAYARAHNFTSISIDLIYGLPKQSQQSFAKTLDIVLDIRPDRISLFNYAHLPEIFKPQRRINEAELPSGDEKLAIFKYSIDFLLANGYEYIGMDHFALPTDELTIAQQHDKLYRNFQGYSTHADCDIIGLGVSSIGQVYDSFAQNEKTLEAYYHKIDNSELAIVKGYVVHEDDKIRKAVIMQLICHFHLDFMSISKEFNIDFMSYFKDELQHILPMQEDGLLVVEDNTLQVLERGKLLIRNICMIFDTYLQHSTTQFSKTI